MPHVIAIVATKSEPERLEHLQFAAMVEICRHREPSPAIPPDLAEAYMAALDQAALLAIENLKLKWDEPYYRVLFCALAAFRGQYRIGVQFLEPDGERYCPACGALIPEPDNWLLLEDK